MRPLLTLAILFTTTCATVYGQDQSETPKTPKQHHKYFKRSTNMDAAIFSTSVMQRPGNSTQLSTVRFTYFFNFGSTYNHNFNDHSGFFLGASIKNIGFIEKFGDSTVKHRVYTIGVPVGLKFGNLSHHNYFMVGGGLDLPFNFKEKGFVSRSHKTKLNEWFSARTPTIMPYVFAGFSVKPGITLKVQYYPGNFLNTSYTNSNGYKPYAGYNVNLLMFTIGADLNLMKGMGMKHKSGIKKSMT